MDIRTTFLNYFKKNRHLVMPSASLIPADDPSVLLTTAGMQQFKPYYLGIQKPPDRRITTVQKCFRTSDIDKVGSTDQHLTFFEMLGNFAFGDYFKKEAISFAAEFILDVLNLPLSSLVVGVFSGDVEIPADSESIGLWTSIGIKPDRIYKFGKSDNFWGPAGDTGPCGPCTEIYYDFGEKFGCGSKSCSPNCECGRYLEIWNLVFTQYNFTGQKYEELPNKNIDTGMGLERIVAVLAGDPSVFKTELFSGIVKKIEILSGKRLLSGVDRSLNEKINRDIKIIADHIRAVVFLIADNVMPSNEARGYILRRVLRRAVRFGRLLEIRDYFLNEIAEIIIREYSGIYPELTQRRDIIFSTIKDEEKRFLQTLKEGTKELNIEIEKIKSSGYKYLEPSYAFKLYDTFGFPVELTTEILNENELLLDIEKFNDYLKSHSERSRAKTIFDKKINLNLDLYKKIIKETEVEFIGYNEFKLFTEIKHLLKYTDVGRVEVTDTLCAGQEGEIILEKTSFYGEKGGEIGDRGTIKSDNAYFLVEDTQIPLEGLVIQRGKVKEGIFKINDKVAAEVSIIFRKNISKNHTSTHMLHWALRNVLGKEISQEGSFVSDDRFRFDYSIIEAPTKENLERVERLINEKIQKDDIVRHFETTKEYAEEIGAISLFNEKYGKYVRVVEIDDYSRELCGGIHVSRTGEIGLFKIISDSSIGANIRRVEAVTGLHAFNYLDANYKILKELASEFDSEPFELKNKIGILKLSAKKMQDELAEIQVRSIKNEIKTNENNLMQYDGLRILVFDFSKNDISKNISAKNMGIIGDELLNEFAGKEVFILFSNIINLKPLILMFATRKLVHSGIDCSKLAKEAGILLKGGGGGKPEFAQVGGSDTDKILETLEFIKSNVIKALKK